METKDIVSYYRTTVEPYVIDNKFFFSVFGGVLATAGLVTFLLTSRGKRFIKDVAVTATDLANEVQNQMVHEKAGRIVEERVIARESV